MAEAVMFAGANRIFELQTDDPLPVMAPMPAYVGQALTYTCWKLSPEELEEINRTGEVWMAARCGQRPIQPHWVGSLKFIKWACTDLGGFIRLPRHPDTPEQKEEA